MSKSRMLSCALIVFIAAGGGVGLWQQKTIRSWYLTWKLQSASPEMVSTYVRPFEAMGLVGIDALLSCLHSKSDSACLNARQVLTSIFKAWPPNDPRRSVIIQQLANHASQFSSAGHSECLVMLQDMVQGDGLTSQIQHALSAVVAHAINNSETRLIIYETMIKALQYEEVIEESLQKQAKSLVIVGTKSDLEAIRLPAIRLAVLPGLKLHEHLVCLVTAPVMDPSADVRQLALLALGEHESLLSTDELCRFLSDPDKEVRTISERAIQLRGLSQAQIKLARLMHDQDTVSRAALPGLVIATPEVDSYQWMERLTKDPSPAVRAATARAIGTSSDRRMGSLMKLMLDQEQDQTVQQIARYYSQP